MNEIQRLELLDSTIWIGVSNGLVAAAARAMINWAFHGQRDYKTSFNGNPANSFEYHVLDVTVLNAAISTYEAINEEIRRGPLGFAIPDLDKLRCHRLHGSHPWTYEWHDCAMKDFVGNDLHYKDNLALRIWQARAAILSRLDELGVTNRPPNTVLPLHGAGVMIRSALEGQLLPGVLLSPDFNDKEIEFFTSYESRLKEKALTPAKFYAE